MSAHGNGSSASARSIVHGVRPPLTAMMKRPRAATAARASTAVNAAPARATESASGSASIFMMRQRRVMPAAGRRDLSLDLSWSPRTRFVLVDRRAVREDRIDNPPRLFDVVLARERRGVAMHGIAEHALVRIHLVRVWKMGPDHLRGRAARLLSRRDDVRADRKRDVGVDSKPAVIRREAELTVQGGR